MPELFVNQKHEERKARARSLVAYLKEAYPEVTSELTYETPFQFLASVILSAQCTDKKVNAVTDVLWKKYRTVADFASLNHTEFSRELASLTYYQNKAKHIIASAKKVLSEFNGEVPRTEKELVTLPGVGYKTAHVVLGELFDSWEGIPTDTHVRRFALRFDLTDHTELTKISKDLEALIPKEDWKYVNNGFVLYGRYLCKALPHECENHPLTVLWPQASTRWPKAV
jgi:endonuclease-3